MPVKSHRGEPGQVKSSPNRVSGDSIRLLRPVFVLYDLVDTWHLYCTVLCDCHALGFRASRRSLGARAPTSARFTQRSCAASCSTGARLDQVCRWSWRLIRWAA